ncbi:hypothetical protein ABZ837_41185 [Streptomyces sp. NPDC047197]|uniref:hypothetical protein n=1 Tax=Streptomyces sp. NPDC047197 TaxID=3155477 RepID=UPI0033C22E4D
MSTHAAPNPARAADISALLDLAEAEQLCAAVTACTRTLKPAADAERRGWIGRLLDEAEAELLAR